VISGLTLSGLKWKLLLLFSFLPSLAIQLPMMYNPGLNVTNACLGSGAGASSSNICQANQLHEKETEHSLHISLCELPEKSAGFQGMRKLVPPRLVPQWLVPPELVPPQLIPL